MSNVLLTDLLLPAGLQADILTLMRALEWGAVVGVVVMMLLAILRTSRNLRSPALAAAVLLLVAGSLVMGTSALERVASLASAASSTV